MVLAENKEDTEISSCIYSHIILNKVAKNILWEKDSFFNR
jgi:hypothetical protein